MVTSWRRWRRRLRRCRPKPLLSPPLPPSGRRVLPFRRRQRGHRRPCPLAHRLRERRLGPKVVPFRRPQRGHRPCPPARRLRDTQRTHRQRGHHPAMVAGHAASANGVARTEGLRGTIMNRACGTPTSHMHATRDGSWMSTSTLWSRDSRAQKGLGWCGSHMPCWSLREARCKASLGESCNHAACILMCALRTFWSTTAAKGHTLLNPTYP